MIEWGVALNVVEPTKDTLANSILLERGGMDSLWITDFPAVRAAAPLAAAVAENTNECRIGVGLLSAQLYGVENIVQKISALIENFGERFDVLIGPGDRDALERIGVRLGTGASTASRTVKTAAQVRDRLRESGYRSRVFLGAQGPRLIAESAKLDGVLLNYSDKDMIGWSVDRLRERDSEFTLGIFPPTLLSPNVEFESCEAIRKAAAMVALGLAASVQNAFGLSTRIRAGQLARERSGKIDHEVLDALGNDLLRRFSMFGGVSHLCRQLEGLAQMGVNLVVFGPPLCTDQGGLELLLDAREQCAV
jgi:alkanesulfonate monooxygenase SsuD/methylene tetrahydromethanopterin reductase-like flavin-dependent oxidoreductase (luciferase family)